jgi:antitoxin component YwqK of YwqJK toxin-antitoxin module
MRFRNIVIRLLFICLTLFFLFPLKAQNITDANGKKQGEWIKLKHGRKVYEGQFKDGIPFGEFHYFYPSGKLKIRNFFSQQGRQNRVKIYFESTDEKLKAEGNYWDKKKDSTWNYFNKSGYLVAVENYQNGLKQGDFRVFNYLGQLNLEQFYENDSLHGLSTEYFETGKLFRQINYRNGKRYGFFKLYYPNGGLVLLGNYENDLRDSIWTTYNEDGSILYLDYYVKGLLNKRTDKDGNKLDFKQEDETTPLNVDPSVFDPSAIKR